MTWTAADADPASGQGWVPPGQLPPQAPADETQQPRPARTWPWFVSIAGALLLVVGLVWVAGGFERRDDLETVVAPGQIFQTGPYEFTFTSATIQKTQNFDDEPIWTVVASGTGRTTGDESLSPDYDDLFVAKDVRSGAYTEPEFQEFGPPRSTSTDGGSSFTPGLPAIPYRVRFEFPATQFAPDATIVLVAWELEWRDTSLLQTGDLRWARTDHYYRLDLPLKRLPDNLR